MQRPPIELPASFKLSDIYYILFRHKWLIVSFLALGAIATLAVYLMQKPLYYSEAKLMVRYIVDTKSVEAGAGNSIRSTDGGSESVLNSELEILTSLDLCEDVATLVGPEKILGNGKSNVTAAAAAVYGGLSVENPRRSNIVKVRFTHRNPELCQLVLRQLIESYFKIHKEVHRAAGSYDDVLTEQAQSLLIRIRADEEELQKLKAQVGVISVEDSKRSFTDRMSRLQQELFEAEAQLAESTVMSGLQPKTVDTPPDPLPTPQDKATEYKLLLGRIDSLRAREFALSENYTDEHPSLKTTRDQLAANEKRRKALEEEFPKLADLAAVAFPGRDGFSDYRPDRFRVPALETKIRVLTNQIAMVRAEIKGLESVETRIAEVERRRKLNLQNYMQYSAGVEAIRFNEAMGAVKMSNIQPVQTPSPPTLNVSKRLKMAAGTFFVLFATGLALALGYELLIDHTVRRANDFEVKFKMPLFLTIPKLGLNGHAKKLPLGTQSDALAKIDGSSEQLRETWAPDHPLRPFVDGLRDRTLIHFGADPHKPKLIGVTGCSKGSGVTSMAAGLAGALSETGDGNVLLLNLNFDSQAVHPFIKGELACGLTDALKAEKRNSGKVLNNLYVATAGNSADPDTQNLSKQLAHVVPQLRVSDYDYIVFDLPPTTPTTPTARLSGMMDLVVLVVEAGKDTHDSVKQASQLLARAKAPVSAVLNKVSNPVPRWLHSGTEVVSS